MNDVELPNRSVQGPSHRPIVYAIEDDPAMAAMMKLKSLMVMQLQTLIKRSNLTQAELAEVCETTQPRISYVVNGNISKISIQTITRMFIKLGYHVEFDFELKTKILGEKEDS